MGKAIERSTPPAAWFPAEQQSALRDFQAVYEAHDAEIETETLRVLAANPVFAATLAGMTPEHLASQRSARLDAIAQARTGDWAAYEAHARALGTMYARSGIRFATWYDLVAAIGRRLVPRLFAAYGDEPARLMAALDAQHGFFDRLMTTVGEEYLAVRDAMAHESDAARRKAESRFARMDAVGLLGIIVTDLDGPVLEINDTLLAMVGYTRDDVLSGRVAWTTLTPPEFRDVDDQAIVQLRSRGVAELREKQYVHADGHRVPVLAGSAVLEGSREVISFVLDLTERKQAEATIESLRQQRVAAAKFRGLLEAAPDAMVIVGADGRIAMVTAQTERVFGYARAELIGQPVGVLLAERFREDLAMRRERYLRTAAFPEFGGTLDYCAVRKDGSEFPVEIRGAPLQTEDGTLLVAALRDITPRKQIENALKLANRELEAFSYSVAHDLRAPLRGMSGFAQLLLEAYGDKLDAEGRDWLSEIQLNAQRMGGLIDALLSLARVSRSAMSPERVDLSALARKVAADLAAREPERAVEVVVAPDLRAELDPALARSLIENLLGNAWKFTRRTERAWIEVGVSGSDGSRAFFVRDNGAGFDMAYGEKLFSPFRRLHTVDEFPGTGIGLATVQRIVHRHGGRVWAEGQVGRGATFYFALPESRAEGTA